MKSYKFCTIFKVLTFHQQLLYRAYKSEWKFIIAVFEKRQFIQWC